MVLDLAKQQQQCTKCLQKPMEVTVKSLVMPTAFFDMEEIVNSELLLQVKWSIQQFTKGLSATEYHRNNRTLKCPILKTHPATTLSISYFFMDKTLPGYTTSLLSSAITILLLAVTQIKRIYENDAIWYDWINHFQHDMLPVSDSKRRLPEIFQTTSEVLQQVYAYAKNTFLLTHLWCPILCKIKLLPVSVLSLCYPVKGIVPHLRRQVVGMYSGLVLVREL